MRQCGVHMLALLAAVLCSSCTTTQEGMGLGGMLGAGTGAIIGNQTGHAGQGALIGGATASGVLQLDSSDTISVTANSTISSIAGAVPGKVLLTSGSPTINVALGAALNIASAINDGGNNYGITKTGPGALKLSTANTLGGQLAVERRRAAVADVAEGALAVIAAARAQQRQNRMMVRLGERVAMTRAALRGEQVATPHRAVGEFYDDE